MILKLLDFLFPKFCLKCGKYGQYACATCLSNLTLLSSQKCPFCYKNTYFGKFCSLKCSKNFHFDQLICGFDYEKNYLLKKLLVQFKYKFSKELFFILGPFLQPTFLKFFDYSKFDKNEIIVIPTPLSAYSLKTRGFNQSFLLAKYFSSYFNFSLLDILKRHYSFKKQARSLRKERLSNLENLIYLNEGLRDQVKNKIIILIDDIATTCSTLNECSKVLKNYGAKYICGLTLARQF